MLGGSGNDRLGGGFGADTLDGGAGTDVANYTKSNAGVEVNLATGLGYGGHAALDHLISIESVIGGNFNDILIGSSSANRIFGGLGDDKLYGGGDNDFLDASKGDDAAFGGDGNDTLSGGDGNDGLFGDAGDDIVYAGNGHDYIEGGAGNDVLWGEAGDDNVLAGAGDDFVVLGAGNDNFTLGAGADRVRFDFGNGKDTITDFGDGKDVIDFTWDRFDPGRTAIQRGGDGCRRASGDRLRLDPSGRPSSRADRMEFRFHLRLTRSEATATLQGGSLRTPDAAQASFLFSPACGNSIFSMTGRNKASNSRNGSAGL